MSGQMFFRYEDEAACGDNGMQILRQIVAEKYWSSFELLQSFFMFPRQLLKYIPFTGVVTSAQWKQTLKKRYTSLFVPEEN